MWGVFCGAPSPGCSGQPPWGGGESRQPEPCGDRTAVPKRPGLRALEWEGRGVFEVSQSAPVPIGWQELAGRAEGRRLCRARSGMLLSIPVLPESGEQVGAGAPFSPQERSGWNRGRPHNAGTLPQTCERAGQHTQDRLDQLSTGSLRLSAHAALCRCPPEPLSRAAPEPREQLTSPRSGSAGARWADPPITPREHEQSRQGLRAPGP